MDSVVFVSVIAAGWLGIGVMLAIVMGRRGHNGFGWLVLGTLLGPLGLILAADARRHEEQLGAAPIVGSHGPAVAGSGPVDVLVGYDGSPESAAAVDAAIEILGHRIGRLTVASVVPFGDIRDQERQAEAALRALADRSTGPAFGLEVLHGHPSTALVEYASQGGFALIVVGVRGKGISKSILGSAASELARDSKVPVLLVGGS